MITIIIEDNLNIDLSKISYEEILKSYFIDMYIAAYIFDKISSVREINQAELIRLTKLTQSINTSLDYLLHLNVLHNNNVNDIINGIKESDLTYRDLKEVIISNDKTVDSV